MKKRILLVLLAVMVALTAPLMSQGQAEADDGDFYPTQDVSWICTSSPGGGSDIFTRMISEIIVQEGIVPDANFVIEYITDGAGEIGRQQVSRTRAGATSNHTLLTFNSGDLMPMVENTNLRVENFTPIALMAIDKHLIFKAAHTPYNTFKEVIDALYEGEEIVLAGSRGDDIGCHRALVEELGVTDAEFAYITHNSTAEAITTILGGHVELLIAKPAAAYEYVLSGDLVPILAVATERFEGDLLGGAPTLSELGDYQNVEVPNWRSVVGPANMSEAAAMFWSDVLGEVAASSTWREDYIERNRLIPDYIGYPEVIDFMKDFEANHLRSLN